jgi:thioredoxin
MPFKELTQDNELASELRNSQQAQLVVVDFYATWCGPCIAIAPFYHQLSVQHPDVLFLKCDVDKCSDTARECNVSAMPTFVFFKGNVELERIRGADKVQLENKVKQYSATSSANNAKNAGSSDDSMQQSQQQSTPGFVRRNFCFHLACIDTITDILIRFEHKTIQQID